MPDAYVYVGTDILRNIEGIQDVEELARFERLMTAWRLEQPSPALILSVAGYRAFHRHIIQDVYDWAGQFRSVDLSKPGATFCRPTFIARAMHQRLELLRDEHGLRGFDRHRFAARAAEHVSELNAIHPFREGNGRTLRSFLLRLGEAAGHPLDLGKIGPVGWHHASVESFRYGRYDLMEDVIRSALI